MSVDPQKTVILCMIIGNDGNLLKVQFAEIYRDNARSRLIFLPGENVGTVYPGGKDGYSNTSHKVSNTSR